MAGQSGITLDHIQNFFSLNSHVEELDVTPTATGGLGIDNMAQFPPPEPEMLKRDKGKEYTVQYIMEEEEEIIEQLKNRRMASADQPSRTSGGTGLDSLEELSTAVGDIADVDNLEDESAQLLYSRFCKEEVKYNEDLLITYYRKQILELIDVNQVMIIQGPTGCGKTTQVPQFIFDQYASMGKYCNIIVTQPRKIAAVSIARRVCEERNWQLGSIVGYQVAMDCKTSPDTRLCYVTTGVLLQKLVNQSRMNMYTHVILDEVHERDQDTDFALLVVKKLLRTNSRDVKVILMSATIDSTIFCNYFTNPGQNDPPSVLEVMGKSKVVTEYYLDDLRALSVVIPEQDPGIPCITKEFYQLVDSLLIIFDKIERHEQNAMDKEFAPVRGSILIFLPGYDEISNMVDRLSSIKVTRKLDLLPLHSSITIEEQTRAFRPSRQGHRKIIIATNIAESSITVPDIKYVIDSCLTKNLVCDPHTNYTSLRLEWASKSNCIQRKGRAGRVDVGRVYRMVRRAFYEQHLLEYNIPEILRCPITQTILFAKKLNFGEPKALLALAIDPPSLCDIQNAVLVLKEVGALSVTVNGLSNPYDGDLTFVGKIMAALPLDVRISKLITYGFVFNCLEDCIIIAACLSLKSFFAKPFQRLMESYRTALSWADGTFSDCLAALNAYKMWMKYKVQGQFCRPGGWREDTWCKHYYIQLRRIKEVEMLIAELKKRLERLHLTVNHGQPRENDSTVDTLILKIVIAGAFYPNYFIQNPVDERDIMKQISNGDPFSTVVVSGLPSNHGVLYYNALHQMFSACSNKMKIEFEDRKAYVKFDSRFEKDNDKTSHIHPAVYFAIKMREMRMPMELTVFSKADADRKIEKLKQLQKLHHDANHTKRLASNRMTVQDVVHAVKSAKLPAAGQLTVSIVVTFVDKCGHFWARDACQTTGNMMFYLDDLINKKLAKHLQSLTKPVSCGMLVLAPFCEQNRTLYYRATVEMIQSTDQIMVFFIDYGNTSMVKYGELREVPVEIEELAQTEALAFECQLSELKPSAMQSSDFRWSKQATQWFQNKVMGTEKRLTGKLYSVLQTVVRMELFEKDSSESINNQLKSLGFAEYAEETSVSKENYEYRKKAEELALQPIKNSEEFLFSPDDLQADSVKQTTQKVRLHGPLSPLEVSFSGVTYVDCTKMVKVDKDSVNSVSLNSEPQDKHQQLLVSSSISLAERSNTLTLRSTTLMPKIKDLLNLVALIFAPHAEFRTDRERTCFTGALCGLGYSDYTYHSLYPEHDMELIFDSVLDYDDIANINRIRMAINLVLSHEDELASWNQHSLSSVQQSLRQTLLALLMRSREPRTSSHFANSYKWVQFPREYVLHPEVTYDGQTNPVLPLHLCINLKKSLHDELREHLIDLKNRAKSTQKPEDITCRLCRVTVSNPRRLLFHLDSDEHKLKVKDILG